MSDAGTDFTRQNACWLVTPCLHPFAFGVPLFCYSSEDGLIVETAVTPLDLPGERCVDIGHVMESMTERPSLMLLIQEALEGAPPAIVDTICAHLTHKRLVPSTGKVDAVHRIDPLAGIISAPEGEIAGVAIGTYDDFLGVLAIERHDQSAKVSVRWVPLSAFTVDKEGFGVACRGLTHEDLLAGLREESSVLAINGIAALLRDGKRLIPSQVAGAFITQIIAGLPGDHSAARKGRDLLDLIDMLEGPTTAQEYMEYALALGVLQQLLALVAEKRKPGKEDVYEQLVARASWGDLYESIVDAVAQVNAIVDGGRPPKREHVSEAIERVALSSRDPYSLKMLTHRGRILSGIGELMIHPRDKVSGEGELERRFRSIAHLVGASGWAAARPYDFGVLAIAIGGH